MGSSLIVHSSEIPHCFTILSKPHWNEKKYVAAETMSTTLTFKKKDKKNNSYAHNLQGNLQSENFSHQDESTFPGRCLHGLELL